jgi:hypothetical protein
LREAEDLFVRLFRHPDSCGGAVRKLEVKVARRTSVLALTYIVRGAIGHVHVPEKCVPARKDRLWEHTCFEAFVRAGNAAGYWEFNLSPSLQWAAYRFDGYREGMAEESGVGDPGIEVRSEGPDLQLSAALDLSGIAALRSGGDWRLGLTAIIEDDSGGKSWWALAHAQVKPDFHHPDTFVLTLPPEAGSRG